VSLKLWYGEDGWSDTRSPEAGQTVLGRLYQSMLLFASGRVEVIIIMFRSITNLKGVDARK
jgi:hypothetical protein